MRTHAIRVAVALSAALLLPACGGDDASPCEELAAIVGDCGGELTEEEFLEEVCENVVLSEDCLEAARDVDCAEHESSMPSYEETCFPSCSDDGRDCRGNDAIRICVEGREIVYLCEGVCAEEGNTYTGTCSNEFEGMMVEDGLDVCWCE